MTVLADWDVLTEEDVDRVVEQAAWIVHARYSFTEIDDLVQEGRILVATRPSLKRSRELGLGTLQHGLVRDLEDSVRTERDRRSKQTSYDAAVEGGVPEQPQPERRIPSGTYDRDGIEALLPAIWDESYCYGLPRASTAPDPSMPKGWTNKSHGNTFWAMLADIKTGWRRAPLTLKERRALLLRFGVGWTEQQIATHEGCSQPTLSVRLTNAVGKVVATINGSEAHVYDEDV